MRALNLREEMSLELLALLQDSLGGFVGLLGAFIGSLGLDVLADDDSGQQDELQERLGDPGDDDDSSVRS